MLLVFALLSAGHAVVYSQAHEEDVIVLRKGGEIVGKILEMTSDGTLKLRTKDGEIYILDMSSVQRTYKRTEVNSGGNQVADTEQGTALTTAQKQEYERKKLSIEITNMSIGSATASGSLAISSWRKWQAYEGFSKIDESEFYAITGYMAESAKSGSYHTINNALIWTGIISVALGVTALLVDANEKLADDTFMVVGGVLAGLGSVGLIVGLARSVNNWAPYSTVAKIADDYNRALMAKLRVSF